MLGPLLRCVAGHRQSDGCGKKRIAITPFDGTGGTETQNSPGLAPGLFHKVHFALLLRLFARKQQGVNTAPNGALCLDLKDSETGMKPNFHLRPPSLRSSVAVLQDNLHLHS